ncbi:MAG: hypothetical protein QGH83_02060 [Candidatus Pacebacteria bacterium]|jgi:hypothetical protein|nr:hypothetical protein [Candidatus Paceibacterota bacterium]|tara:strand:+ start:3533 stop:3832 length:300 start_codon:yes stop_codon:yes gene_type:complete
MKTFKDFVENNMDALKKALAVHKFKSKGGKIDKQPDSMELGSTRYRGLNISKLSKQDIERAKEIAKYRKDKKMRAKLKPTGKTYGRGKKSFDIVAKDKK